MVDPEVVGPIDDVHRVVLAIREDEVLDDDVRLPVDDQSPTGDGSPRGPASPRRGAGPVLRARDGAFRQRAA